MTSTIELLEKKINSLEETLKQTHKYKILPPSYLGALNNPFYNLYLHNFNLGDSLSRLDEI